jgi:hypothetical protein
MRRRRRRHDDGIGRGREERRRVGVGGDAGKRARRGGARRGQGIGDDELRDTGKTPNAGV